MIRFGIFILVLLSLLCSQLGIRKAVCAERDLASTPFEEGSDKSDSKKGEKDLNSDAEKWIETQRLPIEMCIHIGVWNYPPLTPFKIPRKIYSSIDRPPDLPVKI